MAVTVKRISDAKAGDTVWLYEHDRSVFRNGKYVGRGDYVEVTIAERGRQSFTLTIGHEKFDLNGNQRGVRAGYPGRLMGDEDREDARWRGSSFQVARLVERTDIATLRKVAELVGFTLNPRPAKENEDG